MTGEDGRSKSSRIPVESRRRAPLRRFFSPRGSLPTRCVPAMLLAELQFLPCVIAASSSSFEPSPPTAALLPFLSLLPATLPRCAGPPRSSSPTAHPSSLPARSPARSDDRAGAHGEACPLLRAARGPRIRAAVEDRRPAGPPSARLWPTRRPPHHRRQKRGAAADPGQAR